MTISLKQLATYAQSIGTLPRLRQSLIGGIIRIGSSQRSITTPTQPPTSTDPQRRLSSFR